MDIPCPTDNMHSPGSTRKDTKHMVPWFTYPIVVPFGNPNYDVNLGGSHDMDIGAPPNYPVTALLPGRVSSIIRPGWGVQVTLSLDTSLAGVGYMAYLHLSAIPASLQPGNHVNKGDVIGWVGGANTQSQYAGTSNPTGSNFLNDTFQSSRVQVGIALSRGPIYGEGAGWSTFPPVDWSLDPTPIVLAARKAAMGSPATQALGRVGLFFGVETYSYTDVQWSYAASFCKAHKVNFAIIKVFESTQGEWYGGNYAPIFKHFTDLGVKVLPYGFLYGSGVTQGGRSLAWEIATLKKYMTNWGMVCADMEGSWWSGNAGDAQAIHDALASQPGLFLASVPANPDTGTFRPMASVIDMAMPMSYDDYLVSVTAGNMAAIGSMPVSPTLDLSNEFGPNNLVGNAGWAKQYEQVTFWDFGFASGNQPLFDQIVSIVQGGSTVPLPNGWTDDGTTLRNPTNKFTVSLGFRQHVLDAPSWSSWNVPLEQEEGVASLEETNPSLGKGSRQMFVADQMEYQASTNHVFEGWMGRELLFVRRDRDLLLGKYNSLATQYAADQAEIARLNALLNAVGLPADLQSAINTGVPLLEQASSELTALSTSASDAVTKLRPFVK